MKWIKKITLIGLIIFPLISFAQLTPTFVSAGDTTTTVTIPFEEIPGLSLQTIVKLDKLLGALITEDQILAEKAQSDSILNNIEKLLIAEEKANFDSLLTRNLNNKSNLWSGQKTILEKQGEAIEHIIYELSAKSKEVNSELRFWGNTKFLVDSASTDSLYLSSVNEVILHADSIRKIILHRTKICFSILKRIKQEYFEVENILFEVKNIIRLRQEKVFEKTHPSLLALNYKGYNNWNIQEKLKIFKDDNLLILKRFYYNNTVNIFLFLGYLLLLIGIFLFLMTKSRRIAINENNVYQSSVAIILRRPISVAITLGIFSSGLFFNERPPILLDLNILLLTIPILDIVFHVSGKKSMIYLFTFACLILLRFTNYIFPPSTPLHRLNLLFMGILEIIILILLFRKINIRNITNQAFHQFVRIIILVHIFAAIIGLIANLTGQLRLAEIAIDLSITNTLVGLLLIISTVVLVGLLQLVIDSNYLKKFNFIAKRRDLFKSRIVVILMFSVSLLWINYILQILRVNDIFYHLWILFLTLKSPLAPHRLVWEVCCCFSSSFGFP